MTGEVIEVPAKPLVRISKDEALFRLDPMPFQSVVDQKAAALAEAEQAVPQLKAVLDAAEASVREATALRDRSKDEYDRFRKANDNARTAGSTSLPFTESDVENRRLTYIAAEAAVSRAIATSEQAKIAYRTEIDGVNTTVARLEAELRKAEYDLDQTTVRAPADGYVVGLTLRPGQRVANFPLRSWMAFAPVEANRIVVALPQSRIRNVKPGQLVEISFAYRPGRIYSASVEQVIPINASAQLPPSGVLPSLNSFLGPNEFMGVIVELDAAPELQDNLPSGTAGTAAIYTSSAQATHVIRKIMIRMDAWVNYIRPN
ncbi:efflux RND transporter periplasmic adaptor subunit [Labrenzia sp. DG1229]|uniref:HlyD family secretion protein n=1 Tax=Labrenzia sp. DG1229 TaxID=681847 RepID=UPI000689FE6C|nr:efflux RND transporter periplasmic adaptor subunit [Labrenzia sp. DG1229]